MSFEKIIQKLGLVKYVSPATIKSLSTLMSGTMAGALIPVFSSPIMSRIFTSSNYGTLGLYMGISGLIGVLAFSHYTQAIMLPKHDKEASQVLWFSIYFCGGVSIVALLAIGVLSFFTNFITSSVINGWYFVIPISVFLNGSTAALLQWANRKQQYKAIAGNRLIQALFTLAVQLVVGLMLKDETGLLLGLLTGQMVASGLLFFKFTGNRQYAVNKPERELFKELAIRYKSLLFYSTPSEFINTLINQTPLFLLQKFGGLSYVGSYNFTQRILGLPQQFISSAIVDVFRQKAASAYQETGNCRIVFLKTAKALAILGILPFGFLVFAAPSLFAFVFGGQWREAGVFAQFLCILFFFRFSVSPLSYMYIVAGKLKEDFLLHILFLIVTTAAFFVGNLIFEDKRKLILVYSIAYSCVYVIYFFRSYQFSNGASKKKDETS
jgi:O-antigen/teichoic acid export membrane protein